MARADLLFDLIKSGLMRDDMGFRKVAEAICAEERAKQHGIVAQKIDAMLKTSSRTNIYPKDIQQPLVLNTNGNGTSLFQEKMPERRIEQLILSDALSQICKELIEEQMRSDLLRSYGLEPRNKILLIGAPGNGKTSLAETIATSLMVPLYTVKYESIVGAYLGETASRLARLFEYVRTRQCVLFFDEFETLGKERGDRHETGEIKRVVSSLLLQIDALPSYVVIIAATNHETLLDKAAWRRFQIKMELPKPTRRNLELWFSQFEKRNNFNFGLAIGTLAKKLLGKSYAEAEEFALSVYRQYILKSPDVKAKNITDVQLNLLLSQIVNAGEVSNGSEN
jgi:AAA+ superfamily predicted ATPase